MHRNDAWLHSEPVIRGKHMKQQQEQVTAVISDTLWQTNMEDATSLPLMKFTKLAGAIALHAAACSLIYPAEAKQSIDCQLSLI